MALPISLRSSSFVTKLLRLQNPATTTFQFRQRHKTNIKHPWPGHIKRQVLVKVTQPIISEPYVDPATTCTRRSALTNHMDDISEYEHFLIRHQKKVHEENGEGILAFMHLSSCVSKVFHRGVVALRRKGFDALLLNRKVFHHAVKDTKYESLDPVVTFSTVLVYGKQPNVKELMALLKKISHLHLMCAVVEGQLLSKTQVETYATFPDKPSILGQLCYTLDQSAQRTSQLLTNQQEQLVRNLETYSKPDS